MKSQYADYLPESERQRSVDRLEGFSLILPVFNERHAIEPTLAELREILSEIEADYEIIVVNDGSTDGTERVIENVDGVRVIHHPHNIGYGAALKTGIRHAKFPFVVIADADGSYPLDRIPDLLHIAQSNDMVVGARIGANVQYSKIRRIPKWFLTRFAEWLTRRRIPDLNSGLRVIRKSVVERFLSILPDGFSFTTTITMATLTNRYRVHYAPIDYFPRTGKSKIRPIRDTLNFVQLILRTGMYFAPLKVFAPVALVFLFGFFGTFTHDVFVSGNLNERTLLLLIASTQLGMFALLADMIDKRSG